MSWAGHTVVRPNPCPPGGAVPGRRRSAWEVWSLLTPGTVPSPTTEHTGACTQGGRPSALQGSQRAKPPRGDQIQLSREKTRRGPSSPACGLCHGVQTPQPRPCLTTAAVPVESVEGRAVNDVPWTDFPEHRAAGRDRDPRWGSVCGHGCSQRGHGPWNGGAVRAQTVPFTTVISRAQTMPGAQHTHVP